MKERIFTPTGQTDCTVKAWLHDEDAKTHPAIIICPGGGYAMVSPREAEPVARLYFAAGFSTFILTYSVGENAKDLRPFLQLAATIADVRKNAAQWQIMANQLTVCGFSAGAHLACSAGVLFNKPEFLRAWGRNDHIRPDAMILCSPVITADEFAHVGSIKTVSGAPSGTPAYRWFGLDRHVDKDTPPTFLWHTAEDNAVPVENSLKMASALSAARIPFELHVFPHGDHGLSVCTEEVGTPNDYNARWVEWSIQWLHSLSK